MDYSREKIGEINMGIDGTDVYYQYILADTNITRKEFEEYLDDIYHTESNHPGASFCDGVTVLNRPYQDDIFVVIIHYRYDN